MTETSRERNQKHAYKAALAGVEHAHSDVGGPIIVEVDGKSIATAEYLAAVTIELRSLGRRVASDTVRIGGLLNEVKAKLGYGRYTRFVVGDLGWSLRAAYNFRRVHAVFGSANYAEVDISRMRLSVLYRVAGSRVSEEARAVALRAEAPVTISDSIAHEDALGLDEPALVEARRTLGRFRRDFRACFGRVPSLGRLCDEVDRFVTGKQLELADRRETARGGARRAARVSDAGD